MPAAEVLLQDPNIRILDVRDPGTFELGGIPGARNVSMRDLAAVMATIPREAPVLIYCYHCNASQEFGQIFSDFGYLSVHSLDGGYDAWISGDRKLDEWLDQQGYSAKTPHPRANGTTPLMQASHAGQIDVLRLLIASSAALNAKNDDGNNALWLACAGGNFEAIAALIDAGIDIDNQNDNGATVLMYAASAGKTAIVERLLQAGAGLAFQTLDGFTALDMAGNIECLNLLRKAAPR